MRSRTAASLALAELLAVAATLPAVWWEPLHVDEATTLAYAPRSLVDIVKDVFVDKGGAPVHFFVEHVALSWPGGIEGLRLPSVLFFLLALPAAYLVARELGGETEGLLVPPALALAPLAVSLATFGRMYSLFLALVLLATWTCLRAGAEPNRRRWIAAGALCGALVYVHPIAPLYAGLALGSGLVWSGSPARRALREARAGAVALAIVALPYAYALAVLRSRYHVAYADSSLLRTTVGRSIPEESLYGLTPEGTAGAVLLLLAALLGVFRLLGERRRAALILGSWLVVPIAFFSLVPVGRTRFFDRYLIPALPMFLLLVVVGLLALARRRALVGALLVAALLLAEGAEDVSHLDRLRKLDLRALVGAVARERAEAVLFSSTGTAGSGRPPELLDEYVALELPGVERVEELPAIDPRFDPAVEQKGRARVAAFLARRSERRVGVWIFRGPPRRIESTLERLARVDRVVTDRVSSALLVVRSREPGDPRSLVEQGYAVRRAWFRRSSRDRLVRIVLAVDRAALRADSATPGR